MNLFPVGMVAKLKESGASAYIKKKPKQYMPNHYTGARAQT
jgi:hypothetical protein